MDEQFDHFKIITEIIKNFGINRLVFKSEAQFQFRLAWELQKKFENSYEVILENLSAISSYKTIGTKGKNGDGRENVQLDRTKKIFTDILLKNRDGRFVAIELKYKTKENIENDLYEHGAVDLGCFDYLWDLMRVQILKTRDRNAYDSIEFKNLDDNKMIAGFSIILTNEPKYWERSIASYRKDVLYKNFLIGINQEIQSNKTLKWNKKGKAKTCVDDTWRDKAIIRFEKKHNCYWRKYCVFDNGDPFNYLILSIDGNEPLPDEQDRVFSN